MKKYEIIVSDDALTMLNSHIEFLARVSVEAATKLANSVLDDIDSLSDMPERCAWYENQFIPRGRYRCLISCKRYQIVFEITANCVFVDYILDTRQNAEKKLFETKQ